MAKKRTHDVNTEEAAQLTHNPFAALARSMDAAAEVTSPKREAPPDPTLPADMTASAAPFAGKVVVRREKKGRGGKTVTRISGIAAEHRETLAKRMKKALGCGASVEGDDVILLGSLVDRAVDWLAAEGAKRISRSS